MATVVERFRAIVANEIDDAGVIDWRGEVVRQRARRAHGNGRRQCKPDRAEKYTTLGFGGRQSLGNELGAQMKLVADNVTGIVLKDTGHWISEERPKETADALIEFL